MSLNKLANAEIGQQIKLKIGCEQLVCTGDAKIGGSTFPTDPGQPNYSLHTDGAGTTFWAPDQTGSNDLTYDGVPPVLAGQFIKFKSTDAKLVDQSVLVESAPNLSLGGLNITDVALVDGVDIANAGATITAHEGQILALEATRIKCDGTKPMTGNFDVGGNSIVNVNLVDGVDVSALNTTVGTLSTDKLDKDGASDQRIAKATPTITLKDSINTGVNNGGQINFTDNADTVISSICNTGTTLKLGGATGTLQLTPTEHKSLLPIDLDGNDLKNSGKLILKGSVSSNLVDIKASDSTASYSLILPAGQSTGSQVLTNDGSGNLTWESNGSGDIKSDGSVNYTAQQAFSAGNQNLPGVSFVGDTDTGLFQSSAGRIDFGVNNQSICWMSTGGLLMNTNKSINLGNSPIINPVVQATAGTELLPSLTFFSDQDTGIYKPAINTLGITTGGSLAIKCDGNTTIEKGQLRIQDGTLGAPGLIFDSDVDLGIYRAGVNNLTIVSAGSAALKIDSNVSVMKNQLLAQKGTVSLPGYTFSGDTDTGIYKPLAGDNLAITTGGTDALLVDQNQKVSCLADADITGSLTAGADFIYDQPMIEIYHDNTTAAPTTTLTSANTTYTINLSTSMITTHNHGMTSSTGGVITYSGNRRRVLHSALSGSFHCDKKANLHLFAVSSNTTRYPSFVNSGITFPAGTIPASLTQIQYDTNTIGSDIAIAGHFFWDADATDTITAKIVSNTALTVLTIEHLNIFSMAMPGTQP
jgi:hypothetical protein